MYMYMRVTLLHLCMSGWKCKALASPRRARKLHCIPWQHSGSLRYIKWKADGSAFYCQAILFGYSYTDGKCVHRAGQLQLYVVHVLEPW